MSDSTILTLHPQNKSGRKIAKEKYNVMKKAIIEILKNNEVTHNELIEELSNKLHKVFDGNIGWYGETLKLDLEARGIVERTDKKPQTYKIKKV